MNINKAIELLSGLALGDPPAQMSDYVPALKLGIEALKRVKADRYYEIASQKLLPGETKE